VIRAFGLEEAIGTKSRIYYKHEGVSPAGSHKPNTAIPQAYYNRRAGRKRIATETGAGNGIGHGPRGTFFGLQVKVYMVNVSFRQKPYRRMYMETYGAEVVASPSRDTNAGRAILEKDPEIAGIPGDRHQRGGRGRRGREDTSYALGSVLNHVCLHQTVIGLEAREQMRLANDYPDVVIGCCGGGSNLSGIGFPFLRDKLEGSRNPRCVAVEPASARRSRKASTRTISGTRRS
jgi:tryptophan synthase beta chain